jgi:hypothetical protein
VIFGHLPCRSDAAGKEDQCRKGEDQPKHPVSSHRTLAAPDNSVAAILGRIPLKLHCLDGCPYERLGDIPAEPCIVNWVDLRHDRQNDLPPARSDQVAVIGHLMLVDVVCLRRDGKRLPDDDVAKNGATRGELALAVRHQPQPGGGSLERRLIATLTSGGRDLLQPLHGAVVGVMRGDSFVVHGTETWTAPQRPSHSCRQTWSCRLVTLGSPPGRRAELN